MPDDSSPEVKAAIAKRLARAAGFDDARIANAAAPAVLANLRDWVDSGHAGLMAYMNEQVDQRSDVKTAFPWACSVVVAALQYDTPHPYSSHAPEGSGWIARYAWGDDYHQVVRARLETLRRSLGEACGPFESRAYVDTGRWRRRLTRSLRA